MAKIDESKTDALTEDEQATVEEPVKKKKPKDCIVVKLRDLTSGEVSLVELSTIECTGKVAYWISKWMRKIRPEIEDFRKEVTEIMKRHGAEPGKRGTLQLDVKSESYKEANEELEKFQESVLDEDIYIENVKPIKLDELMAALPKPPKPKDSEEEEETKPRIKPYILADLWFLIEE